MKLSDIVALARQGYKPADIKELMKLADPQPEPKKDPEADPQPEPKKDPEADPQPEPKKDPEADPQPDPDYKKLYEESLKQIKNMQAKNRKDASNIAEQKTDEEIAADYINDLLKGVS